MKILIVDKIHPSFNNLLKKAKIDYKVNLYESKTKIYELINEFDGIVIVDCFR